jgi:RNA polymerase sigma-70 factor (ECF subfamily)
LRPTSSVNITRARGQQPPSPPPAGDWQVYAGRFIRHQACQLVQRAGLPASDRSDLEQELWLDLLKRWPRFDAGRAGGRTFAARLVRHQAIKILSRQREVAANPARSVSSLHDVVAHEDGRPVPLVHAVDEETQARRIGGRPRLSQDLFELRSDVRQVVARLPVELRDVCDRLTRCSVSQAACELGITRASFYRRLAKVRSHLSRAGLREYL